MNILTISKPVGKNCPNIPQDVKAVTQALVHIGKIARTYISNGVFDQVIQQGINDTQRHWMLAPDGVISVGGRTRKSF